MNKRLDVSDLVTEEYRIQEMGNYSPMKVKVGEKTGFLMVNNHGTIMSKEKFLEFVERATLAYDSKDIESFIQFHNFKADFPIFETKKVEGKFLLPKPNYFQSEFRKDLKKDWGFKCDWCEEKVSSKTDDFYFTMKRSLDLHDFNTVEGRFCQGACAENFWYEALIEIVMEKKVTDFVHTDKRIGQ